MTLDFVLALLDAEKIGQGFSPDVPGLSLTATDYIGHAFGPDSLEYEDQVLRVDALLAKLFAAIDRKIGLSNTLIVLIGDHGVELIPEIRLAERFPAGRLYPDAMRDWLNEALRKKFRAESLCLGFYNPCFFLDEGKIRRLGLDREAVKTPRPRRSGPNPESPGRSHERL